MVDYLHPLAAPFHLEGDRDDDAVVLLHGWTGSPAHFRVLGSELNRAGFTVAAPLLAGHGTRIEDMVTTGWRDWMRSGVVAALELGAAGKRIHLVGLSMGGDMALLMAPALGAVSITTINAPQRVWDRRMRLANLVRGSHRINPGGPPVPVPAEMREFQQQYVGTPVGTVAELRDLIRAAHHNLHRVTCPALIIQSRADETVRSVSGEIIYNGIGSADKTLLWLEKSPHVALLGAERAVVADAVLKHVAGNSGIRSGH